MTIKAILYQISCPNIGIINFCKYLGTNNPRYGILEGTIYMYLVAIPYDSQIDIVSLFNKYNVKYLEPEFVEFDHNKFNSDYKIGITYGESEYYVLRELDDF